MRIVQQLNNEELPGVIRGSDEPYAQRQFGDLPDELQSAVLCARAA